MLSFVTQLLSFLLLSTAEKEKENKGRDNMQISRPEHVPKTFYSQKKKKAVVIKCKSDLQWATVAKSNAVGGWQPRA